MTNNLNRNARLISAHTKLQRLPVYTLLLLMFFCPSFLPADQLPQLVEHEELNEFVVVFSPKKLYLDPLHIYTTMESELSTALYEGLLSYNPISLEPIPGVAKEWEAKANF